MGVSAKTLGRIKSLHEQGFLKTGSSIIALGAQEVYCGGEENYVREFIDYFSAKDPSIKSADQYSSAEISHMANKGFMGRLMSACGFKYCALDIFEAEDTILFDLNIREPGDDLREKFDLVTNFGTSEHVINQYQSMKTIHDLAKPGGIIYNAVPMSGYLYHGYFSYTPVFFFDLAAANAYRVVMQSYHKNPHPTDAAKYMTEHGYPDKSYYDCYVEFIFQKISPSPFRMPLETRTSLGLRAPECDTTNLYARNGQETEPSMIEISPLLDAISGWDLQRELIKRYKRRLKRLFGFR